MTLFHRLHLLGTIHISHTSQVMKSILTHHAIPTHLNHQWECGISDSFTTSAALILSSMKTSLINVAPPLYSYRRCLPNSCRHHLDIQTTMKWRRTDHGREGLLQVYQQRHHRHQSVVGRYLFRRAANQVGGGEGGDCPGRPRSARSLCHPPILMCLTSKKLREYQRYPMLVTVMRHLGTKNIKTLPLNNIKIILIQQVMKMECNHSLMKLPTQHLRLLQHRNLHGVRMKRVHSFLIR
ncbi:uncharacterized protein LOC125050604 [Pieris napi]|uniref:uncharacterized protein LOC125050604 n=1 Tax=Pieris napi TaxID=78633 RepID=UPI001FB88FD1|nr:uncharacterized protein LOC125050604 [Pieris napi]